MRGALLCCSFIACYLLGGRDAAASAPGSGDLPFTLTWQAPAGCPSRSDIENELRRLAKPRPGATLEPLVASGVVEQRGGQFVLQLSTETHGERGTSVLTAARCDDLQRAATLVLVLVFGDAVELGSAPAQAPVQESPPVIAPVAPVAAPVHDHVATSASASASRRRVQLEAGAQLTFRVTPRVSYGPRVGVTWRHDAALLRASISAGFSSAAPLNARVDVDFWSGAASGGACYAPAGRPIAVGACVGVAAGFIAGSASGASESRSAVAPWYAIVPSLLVAFGGEKPTLVGEAGLAVVPLPPRFEVAGAGAFASHRLAPFVGLAAAF